jgi:type I restriction enzyme M protein
MAAKRPPVSAGTFATLPLEWTSPMPDGSARAVSSYGRFGSDLVRLSPTGPIIDFLDPSIMRPNTPEEAVRQSYARKLNSEYGYSKDVMAFGAPIAIGSEMRYADIVIYDSPGAAQRKDQAAIRIVVETKAPDVKTGHAQLKSYILASSAEGGVWINETDAPRYWRRENRHLTEWPNIPHAEEDWDSIGKHKKGQLRRPYDLVETFKRCHNALYKVGIDSEDLAMDMVRMILAKYRDELNEGDNCEFRCTALELQSTQGRKRVAERVQTLFARVRDDNRDVFGEHEKITAGDREIAIVVSELQDFRFLPEADSDEVYDVVGAAYEVYVSSHLRGDRGQYFTHRLIVNLLVKIVDPSEDDILLDVAMGSGGFLISGMRHVTQKILRSRRPPHLKKTAIMAFYKRIFGIDKSPKLVKVARTNMILASDGHSGLVRGDTLERPDKLPDDFIRRAGPGVPTVILTNPPFGATSEHKITAEKEPEILEQFDLGKVWKRDDGGELHPTDELTGEGVPPEYLFVERCIRWVKPGGKVGIVVPRGVLDNIKALPVRTLILRETRVLAVINCHDDTFKPHTDAKCALLLLEKKPEGRRIRSEDYTVFMAISQGIGHNGLGEPIYKTDAKGDPVLVHGEMVLDEDTGQIAEAWALLTAGRKSPHESYFTITRKQIEPDELTLNPVRYLPKYEASRQHVFALGEEEAWTVERLGQIAQVFNGPRFKRPYADKGVTRGPKIIRYFTGNAVTQTRAENIKYLDLEKAKPLQLKMIEKLYLQRGMILITDSGTVGRVVYATAYHDGAVGTNNLIRVVVENEALRGYIYQFLLSRLGQDQLKRNIYGAIVDHIEPPDVKSVLVPIPKDPKVLEAIGRPVIRAMQLQELAFAELEQSRISLLESMEDTSEEDKRDAAIARQRLKELEEDPSLLISGDELKARLDELLA